MPSYLYEFLCLCFGLGVALKLVIKVYKKNPNCSFEANKNLNNCLSGQDVTDGVVLKGNFDRDAYVDFSVSKFVVFFFHENGKVNSSISNINRVLEITDNTEEMALFLSEEKLNYTF